MHSRRINQKNPVYMKINGKRINILPLIAVMFLMAGCLTVPDKFSAIAVTVPPGINLTAKEIREMLPEKLLISGDSEFILEISVYDYSSGKEHLIYDKSGEFTGRNDDAYVKALLTLKRKNRLEYSLYAEGHGPDRKAMLDSLIKDISRQLKLN